MSNPLTHAEEMANIKMSNINVMLKVEIVKNRLVKIRIATTISKAGRKYAVT